MSQSYYMFLNITEEDSQGFYLGNNIGVGKGLISSGVNVVSNNTGGEGNLTGHIAPQITGVFQLIPDIETFVNTNGDRMTLQNNIGQNELTMIKGFLEFLLKTNLFDMKGDCYQAVNDSQAWIVSFTYSDGTKGSATMVENLV